MRQRVGLFTLPGDQVVDTGGVLYPTDPLPGEEQTSASNTNLPVVDSTGDPATGTTTSKVNWPLLIAAGVLVYFIMKKGK